MRIASILALTVATCMTHASPCAQGAVQAVITTSLSSAVGLPCASKIGIPASAYGDPTVIANYTAIAFESNAECTTWWGSAIADIKAISPACEVRVGLTTTDLAAMNITQYAAEVRLEGQLAFPAYNASRYATTTNASTPTATTTPTPAGISSGNSGAVFTLMGSSCAVVVAALAML
ncbi:Aste57867_10663 [Aphanomyces stellatus]|uniref:Aste57867_10663 protein n=1 Tax=Aphanomyces stellatus TaxID=120398 RepID=A0A485KSJ0_9STRA|nr:hypothetical protein As57867_010623 [Aphanomyces stellatus]VFT87535.1 Aste57867_10663 [Aphanomyces stellatus]